MSAEFVAERPGDGGAPPSGRESRGALLGREREQSELTALIDSVVAGGTAVGLVRGEPGVGTTALVSAAADVARRRSASVLYARAVAVERTLPNALLQVLLLHLVDGPAAVFSQPAATLRLALGLDVGRAPTVADLAAAVIALLADISTHSPVVIVVDDLHHADKSSAKVLDAVAAARLPRVGVLATVRTSSHSRIDATTVIDIAPLDDNAAAELVRRFHPGMAADVHHRILAAAQGNPLALRALPAELRHEQIDGSASLPTVLPMSTVLRDRLFPDLPVVQNKTLCVLLMHALAPELSVDDLASTVGARTLSDVLAPAVRAGLVAVSDVGDEARPTTEPRIRLTRALLGPALMSLATDDQRSAVYRLLARSARGVVDDISDIYKATTTFDDALAERLELAAEVELCTGRWRSGLARLRQAVEVGGDRRERHRRLARATQVAARVDHQAAQQMFIAMHTGRQHFEDSITDALAASAIIVTNDDGDVDTAYQMLMDALERSAPRDSDDPVVVEAIESLRELSWLGGRAALWEGYRRIVDAVAPGAPSAVGLSAAVWDGPSTLSADQRATVDSLIADLSVDHSPLWIGEVAEMAATFDRIDECRPVLDVLIDGVNAGHDVASRPSIAAVWAMLLLAQDAFNRGRWTTTMELAQRAKEICGVDGHDHLGWLADYLLGMVAAVRGEDEMVEHLAARMRAWAIPRRAFVLVRFAEHLWTLLAGGHGDAGAAYIHATAVSPIGQLGPYVSMTGTLALDLVRSAIRTGRDEDARAHVAAMRDAGLDRVSSRLAMITLACRALVSTDDSERLFEAALAVPGARQWVFDYARIQYIRGMELRRDQELVAARRQLREALSTFVELGASSWASRAQAELDATAPTRHVTAVDSQLTAYERRIASMVASGLTNKAVAERLDISHRTVGNHLYRIYAKLGVTSRGELRDALAAPIS